jgi:predicted nucleotidyltransferase
MLPRDRRILDRFAAGVRAVVPSASVWAFGSRARGSADPDSDLDLCIVVPVVTPEVRDTLYAIAWEIGFDEGLVLAPIVLSEDDFEHAPLSASSLVRNIRREGVAA